MSANASNIATHTVSAITRTQKTNTIRPERDLDLA